MYLLLWMNVMLDFIGTGFAELWELEGNEKCQMKLYLYCGIRTHARHGQRKVIQRPRPIGHQIEIFKCD